MASSFPAGGGGGLSSEAAGLGVLSCRAAGMTRLGPFCTMSPFPRSPTLNYYLLKNPPKRENKNR